MGEGGVEEEGGGRREGAEEEVREGMGGRK